MQSFKSTFGFNTCIVTALEKKTRDMEGVGRRGGLVFDGIKLSKNISVTASGELNGFVDLGSFTDSSNTATGRDHGLIIMFEPFQGKCFK